MKICFACSEVVPLAKTGGLADVCGALPGELRKLGHEVSLFAPAYRSVKQAGVKLKPTGLVLEIPVGSKMVPAEVLTTTLPESEVRVYLIDQPQYYDRSQLYGESGRDYPDNCERFVFFCRAVLEAIRSLRLDPEVLHAHDWQTGLLPTYLKTELAGIPPYDQITSVFTIHNLAYQGRFWHWDMLLTGLDWKHFNWRELEFYGQLNLLKAGIVFADSLTTVSPTYAREIQTAEQGCGLEGVLLQRSDALSGILNGIDPAVWNPATDRALSRNYSVRNWREGKAACKAELQHQLGLEVCGESPLIGAVGRLVSQKGWALILPVMQQWLPTIDAQWVVLGTGEPEYEQQLARLQQRYPGKLAVQLKFADELAHRIEAGSDLFLMPSQYEPCGLNQMYSMVYGSVPVVRSTGGLFDTVVDATPCNLERKQATGFTFGPFLSESLEQALARAVCCYRNQPLVWSQLVETGMSSNWSWSESARKYEQLYERAICLRLSRTAGP